MQDQPLVSLMSEIARLLSARSSTPRVAALRIAHGKLRAFAQGPALQRGLVRRRAPDLPRDAAGAAGDMSIASSLPRDLSGLKIEGTDLTAGETQVLRLLARGLTRREVGRRLNKSDETVKALSKTCRSRLRARNTTHAVAIAVSLDLI